MELYGFGSAMERFTEETGLGLHVKAYVKN